MELADNVGVLAVVRLCIPATGVVVCCWMVGVASAGAFRFTSGDVRDICSLRTRCTCGDGPGSELVTGGGRNVSVVGAERVSFGELV